MRLVTSPSPSRFGSRSKWSTRGRRVTAQASGRSISATAVEILRRELAQADELPLPELLARAATAPDLALLEVANVLCKRVRRGELVAADAMTAVGDLGRAAIRWHSMGPLALPALGLALAHGLTAYDAAYVALAARIGGVVVSSDAALRGRATEAGLPVAGPGDVP